MAEAYCSRIFERSRTAKINQEALLSGMLLYAGWMIHVYVCACGQVCVYVYVW